jgi:hypothetical protein
MDAITNLELARQAAVKHAAAVKESLGNIGTSFSDATKEAEEFGATTGVEKFQLKIKTALQGLKENLKNIFSGDTDLGQEELTALANRWGVASDSINTYEKALAVLSPAMQKLMLQANPVLQELQEKFKTLSMSIDDSLDLTEAQKFFREVSRGTKEVEGLVAGLAKIDPAGLRELAANMGLVAIDGETVAALANRIGTEWTGMLNSLNPAIDSAREMVKQLNIDLADAAADTPLKQMALEADRAAASFRVLLESMEANGNYTALEELSIVLKASSADIDDMVSKFRTGVVSLQEDAQVFKVNVGDMLANSMTQVFTGIARGTREAKDILKGFQDFTISVFGDMFSQMLKQKLDFDAVWEKNWLEDIPGAVGKAMESVGNMVLKTMALVINALSEVFGDGLNLKWGKTAIEGAGGVPYTGQIGPVRQDGSFAQGGITTGPRMAMVGDNPSGTEAIIPLERWKEVMGNSGGGGQTQVIIHAPTALASQERKKDSQGREMLEFIFEGAKGAVVGDILSGGPVSQAMGSVFGTSRRGGR